MAIVYLHIRKDTNEPFYVGIGEEERRAYVTYRTKHWRNIVNSVGYDVIILHKDIDWDEACKIEIDLIKLYGRRDLGTGSLVNLTDGGDRGVKGLRHKPESKKIMSEKKKGLYKGIPRPPAVIEKMKISAQNSPHRKNKYLNLGDKFKGRHHTEESKQKIRSYRGEKSVHYGKKKSAEHIAKIVATRRVRGYKPPPITEEHKRVVSQAQRRRIKCPHCEIVGQHRAMHRWHLDNCKKKKESLILT